MSKAILCEEQKEMENHDLQELTPCPTGPQESLAGTALSKSGRRRNIDPTTCERDYTADEIEFMQALDEYKRQAGRMFPTCSEILEVIGKLHYVKLAPAAEPQGDQCPATC